MSALLDSTVFTSDHDAGPAPASARCSPQARGGVEEEHMDLDSKTIDDPGPAFLVERTAGVRRLSAGPLVLDLQLFVARFGHR
jgi:hypothetical protein